MYGKRKWTGEGRSRTSVGQRGLGNGPTRRREWNGNRTGMKQVKGTGKGVEGRLFDWLIG